MTMTRIILTLLLALATSLPAQSAPPRSGGGGSGGGYRGGGHGGHYHHGGGTRWSIGVGFGGYPFWGGYYPWGYPYAYYPYYPYYPYSPAYYAAPAVQQDTTYIERPVSQAQQQQQPQAPTGYWYYCSEPGAYYPYIKECPAGWQRVAPQPSN